MALIYCPHCGKPISDKAEKCIHCGVTFNEENAYSNTQDSPPAVVDEQKPKVKSDNSGNIFCGSLCRNINYCGSYLWVCCIHILPKLNKR